MAKELIVSATGRFDGQKLKIEEALQLARANHALPAIQGVSPCPR